MNYGVQQLMIGKILKNNNKALSSLEDIKSFGFDYIELDGFMIRKMPLIVKWLTDLSGMPTGNSTKLDWINLVKQSGLNVIAIHEDLGTIENNMDLVIDECSLYACTYVVVTGMYQYDYDSLESLDSLTERLNKAGEALLDNGLHLLYHNHNVEFSRLENGLTAYEYMICKLDPRYVNFELDAYWATDAGCNVFNIIDLLGSRLKLLHVNDKAKKKKGKAITPIVKYDACELGNGVMDIKGIIEHAEKVGCTTVILEQHKNHIDNDPLKSVRIAGDYLKTIK